MIVLVVVMAVVVVVTVTVVERERQFVGHGAQNLNNVLLLLLLLKDGDDAEMRGRLVHACGRTGMYILQHAWTLRWLWQLLRRRRRKRGLDREELLR